MNTIIKKIEALPPLPKTIIDIIEFSNKQEKTSEELIDIIKYDSLLIAMLLKIANSALFGFKNKVETIENLVNLLGIDFTISLTLSNSLQNSFDINFSPYTIDTNRFREVTVLSVNFLILWVSKIDFELKNNLLLQIVLSDLGKYILCQEIIQIFAEDKFSAEIQKDPLKIDEIEKKYCNFTSKDITILLLEHWGISQNIINHIKGVDKYTKSSQILDIVKIICNIVKPLDDNAIKLGLQKASEYGFDEKPLIAALDKIQDRIENTEDL